MEEFPGSVIGRAFLMGVPNSASIPQHACVVLFCHWKPLGREHASLWNVGGTWPLKSGVPVWPSVAFRGYRSIVDPGVIEAVPIVRISGSSPLPPALLRYNWHIKIIYIWGVQSDVLMHVYMVTFFCVARTVKIYSLSRPTHKKKRGENSGFQGEGERGRWGDAGPGVHSFGYAG